MKEKLQGILQSAKEQLAAAADARALDEARVKFLGKKGELTALLKGMKDVAAEERPVVGQLINDVRAEIETIIDKQKKLLREFEETSTDENQIKRKSFWDKVKDALKDK